MAIVKKLLYITVILTCNSSQIFSMNTSTIQNNNRLGNNFTNNNIQPNTNILGNNSNYQNRNNIFDRMSNEDIVDVVIEICKIRRSLIPYKNNIFDGMSNEDIVDVVIELCKVRRSLIPLIRNMLNKFDASNNNLNSQNSSSKINDDIKAQQGPRKETNTEINAKKSTSANIFSGKNNPTNYMDKELSNSDDMRKETNNIQESLKQDIIQKFRFGQQEADTILNCMSQMNITEKSKIQNVLEIFNNAGFDQEDIVETLSSMTTLGIKWQDDILDKLKSFDLDIWDIPNILGYMSSIGIKGKDQVLKILNKFKAFNFKVLDICKILEHMSKIGIKGKDQVLTILDKFTKLGFDNEQNEQIVGILENISKNEIKGIQQTLEILDKFTELQFTPDQIMDILGYMSDIEIKGKDQVFQILDKFTELKFIPDQIIDILDSMSDIEVKGKDQVCDLLDKFNQFRFNHEQTAYILASISCSFVQWKDGASKISQVGQILEYLFKLEINNSKQVFDQLLADCSQFGFNRTPLSYTDVDLTQTIDTLKYMTELKIKGEDKVLDVLHTLKYIKSMVKNYYRKADCEQIKNNQYYLQLLACTYGYLYKMEVEEILQFLKYKSNKTFAGLSPTEFLDALCFMYQEGITADNIMQVLQTNSMIRNNKNIFDIFNWKQKIYLSIYLTKLEMYNDNEIIDFFNKIPAKLKSNPEQIIDIFKGMVQLQVTYSQQIEFIFNEFSTNFSDIFNADLKHSDKLKQGEMDQILNNYQYVKSSLSALLPNIGVDEHTKDERDPQSNYFQLSKQLYKLGITKQEEIDAILNAFVNSAKIKDLIVMENILDKLYGAANGVDQIIKAINNIPIIRKLYSNHGKIDIAATLIKLEINDVENILTKVENNRLINPLFDGNILQDMASNGIKGDKFVNELIEKGIQLTKNKNGPYDLTHDFIRGLIYCHKLGINNIEGMFAKLEKKGFSIKQSADVLSCMSNMKIAKEEIFEVLDIIKTFETNQIVGTLRYVEDKIVDVLRYVSDLGINGINEISTVFKTASVILNYLNKKNKSEEDKHADAIRIAPYLEKLGIQNEDQVIKIMIAFGKLQLSNIQISHGLLKDLNPIIQQNDSEAFLELLEKLDKLKWSPNEIVREIREIIKNKNFGIENISQINDVLNTVASIMEVNKIVLTPILIETIGELKQLEIKNSANILKYIKEKVLCLDKYDFDKILLLLQSLNEVNIKGNSQVYDILEKLVSIIDSDIKWGDCKECIISNIAKCEISEYYQISNILDTFINLKFDASQINQILESAQKSGISTAREITDILIAFTDKYKFATDETSGILDYMSPFKVKSPNQIFEILDKFKEQETFNYSVIYGLLDNMSILSIKTGDQVLEILNKLKEKGCNTQQMNNITYFIYKNKITNPKLILKLLDELPSNNLQQSIDKLKNLELKSLPFALDNIRIEEFKKALQN